MSDNHYFFAFARAISLTTPAFACEPVVPFMQVMVPALALTRSILVLLAAVVLKSLLFGVFERRLPHTSAAWRMFLGNVLTSFVGLLVAVMIASSAGLFWLFGVPIVCILCWLPARRLVKEAPLAWMKRTSPLGIATAMTVALLASCIFFVVGQGAIRSHRLALYWFVKVVAIFLALLASISLTTIWEEWVIWRLSSRPQGTNYFTTVLRTNLYVLMVVMAVPAALILPTRLKSPDFLAHLLNGAP
jgi:hypothetical protein